MYVCDVPTTQTLGQLVAPIAENEQLPTTEFESPDDSQNEQPVMMTTLSIQHSDHDSCVVTETGETIAVLIAENEVEEEPITTWFDYTWSILGLVVTWFFRQNLSESLVTSMVNLDSNSSDCSRRGGQTITDANEHAPTPSFLRFASPNNQIQDQSLTIGVHADIDSSIPASPAAISNQTTHQLSRENVLADIENQIESSNHPPMATLIATTPHTAQLHDYSNPKNATYFAGVYATFIALLSLKFIAGKHNTPFDTHIPFMIISVVAYLMAILDLGALFFLYDRLRGQSNQHFSPGHYKILTYVFYILWILAILAVVPLLFTRQR